MSLKSKILRELEERPRRMKELKDKLGNDKKVHALVEKLEQEHKLIKENGRYQIAGEGKPAPQEVEGIPCTLVKLAPKFGFARREDGEGDVFIPGKCLMGAMPDDEIKVQLFPDPRVPGSQEGEVVCITKPRKRFVGRVVELANGELALEPDRCPGLLLAIRRGAEGGARPGDKAAVELLERGEHHSDHLAGVSMRFGSSSSAAQCTKAILYDHNVERRFPEKVRDEAHRLPDKVTPKDMADREDFRDWAIFTIDSAQTKDIDDAISILQTESGFSLGVHIADVSHYVRPDTCLDDEAFVRGTSIYYADNVIPMLPKQLSNGICSLNEGEDRLAFSCLMELNRQGVVTGFRFTKSVIRSRVKGVYSEVNAILDGTSETDIDRKYCEVSGQFEAMRRLYELRLALRRQRGGMEIESGESKLILDQNGICVDVKKRTRGLSECMIEEFMLLANECAAKLGRENQLPLVYRVHEKPETEKVSGLLNTLQAVGMDARFKEHIPTQTELEALLEKTRNTPLERVVHTGVLRSMQKAKYEPTPLGHYGLALEDYAHFTSPIRRYPDLCVHRVLSVWLSGNNAERINKKYAPFIKEASKQSSRQELEAMKVEREAEACYKAEFMAAHLGERYVGRVSGVTAHGLFVELPSTVEGFLPAEALFNGEGVLTEGVRLSDPLTGKVWMLGDEVPVIVAAADVALGRVEFAPGEATAEAENKE